MFKYLAKRLAEPSTYAGIAAVAMGAGQLFQASEGQAVAEAAGQAGQAVAAGADPYMAGAVALAGLFAAIMRDRKDD